MTHISGVIKNYLFRMTEFDSKPIGAPETPNIIINSGPNQTLQKEWLNMGLSVLQKAHQCWLSGKELEEDFIVYGKYSWIISSMLIFAFFLLLYICYKTVRVLS
jgi:hypothetical protein